MPLMNIAHCRGITVESERVADGGTKSARGFRGLIHSEPPCNKRGAVAQTKPSALTDVVCVSASQVASRVGDDVAILDLDRSSYYGLNPVGARIWELIQEPTALSAVLAAVVAEFEVDEATARADLLALIDELIEKRLVTVHAADVR